MDIYINIDEVADLSNPVNYLLELKGKYSNFKTTLFVSLMRCSKNFLEILNGYDWIEVCLYGIYGKPRELEFYNRTQLDSLLKSASDTYSGYFTKGFKAPQFAYTSAAYELCKDNDFWIDMHPYHIKPFLQGIKYYQFDYKSGTSFEFAGHANNNSYDKKGLDQSYKQLVQILDHIDNKAFKFCSENIKVNE